MKSSELDCSLHLLPAMAMTCWAPFPFQPKIYVIYEQLLVVDYMMFSSFSCLKLFCKIVNRVVATVENLGDKATGQRIFLLLSKSDDSQQVTPRSAKKSRKESKKEIGTVVDAEVRFSVMDHDSATQTFISWPSYFPCCNCLLIFHFPFLSCLTTDDN